MDPTDRRKIAVRSPTNRPPKPRSLRLSPTPLINPNTTKQMVLQHLHDPNSLNVLLTAVGINILMFLYAAAPTPPPGPPRHRSYMQNNHNGKLGPTLSVLA